MTHTLIDIDTLKTIVWMASGAGFKDPATDVAQNLISSPIVPTVVVNITGGIMQGASADYPVDIYVLDFDTEGASDDDTIQIDGHEAFLGLTHTVIDDKFVAEVVELAG